MFGGIRRQRDDRIAKGRIAVGYRPGEVRPPAPDGDRGQGHRYGGHRQPARPAVPASTRLLDHLDGSESDRDTQRCRQTERPQEMGRAAFDGRERRDEEDGQRQQDQGVARVAAHPPQPHQTGGRDNGERQRQQRQRRNVVARIRITREPEHRHRSQEVDERVGVGMDVRVERARPRHPSEVVERIRDRDRDHRRGHDQERRRERHGSRAQALICGPVGVPQPHQPHDHEHRQQLERLVRIHRRERRHCPGQHRRPASRPGRPVQQRQQRQRPEERHDRVAHPVPAHRHEPQRARRPGSRHDPGPRPELAAQVADRQHSRHAERGGRRPERQGARPGEVEDARHHVREERLSAAVAREPDTEVGVPARATAAAIAAGQPGLRRARARALMPAGGCGFRFAPLRPAAAASARTGPTRRPRGRCTGRPRSACARRSGCRRRRRWTAGR